MSDSFTISTSPSPAQRPPSRREIVWEEPEQIHLRLLIEPTTTTLTPEDLAAEAERVRLLVVGVQHLPSM